jgi:hypothetical protein
MMKRIGNPIYLPSTCAALTCPLDLHQDDFIKSTTTIIFSFLLLFSL